MKFTKLADYDSKLPRRAAPAPRNLPRHGQSRRLTSVARLYRLRGGGITTIPRCFVQATPRVQQYLLRAGVVSALDLAGWWCSLEKVWAPPEILRNVACEFLRRGHQLLAGPVIACLLG